MHHPYCILHVRVNGGVDSRAQRCQRVQEAITGSPVAGWENLKLLLSTVLSAMPPGCLQYKQ